jgi:hypothetical protein
VKKCICIKSYYDYTGNVVFEEGRQYDYELFLSTTSNLKRQIDTTTFKIKDDVDGMYFFNESRRVEFSKHFSDLHIRREEKLNQLFY